MHASLSPLAVPLDTWASALHHRLEVDRDYVRAVETLRADLWMLRRSLDPGDWAATIATLRDSDLVRSLHQDPFSRHAYERPRGYPGDAPLLDLIYDGADAPQARSPSALGAAVSNHTIQSPACAAVRWRKDHLAGRLTALPAEAKVLSLACGHLREARTAAARGVALPEIHGVDQDALSLQEARDSLVGHNVHIHHGGVKELLKGTLAPDQHNLDLAYSAGLYDYLDQDLATAVSTRLFERVRVGGCALVANFVPNVPDVGFMEVVMDWNLIYRTEAELAATFDRVSDRARVETYTGPFGNIGYAVATRLR